MTNDTLTPVALTAADARVIERREPALLSGRQEPLAAHETFVPPIVRENQNLRALADWAETLLCNARPMAHCAQGEWDSIVAQWRDQKHGLRVKTTGELVQGRKPEWEQ